MDLQTKLVYFKSFLKYISTYPHLNSFSCLFWLTYLLVINHECVKGAV